MKALLLPALAGLALTGSPAVAQEMIAELSCHAVSPDGSERTLLIGRPLLDRTAADGQFHLNRPGEGSLSAAERALAAERLEQYTAMVNSGA